MTIRHLRIFIAVAETGKMSAAAEQLYLSQPTVSQTIRELENHYGVQLFERYSQKLFITEAGKRLLKYAQTILLDFDRLEENMLTYGGNTPLRIGATVCVGSIVIPHVLRELEKIMPQTDTFVTVGNTAAIEQKLLRAQVDVGIMQGKIQSSELTAIPAVPDELVIVCSPDHPLAQQRKVTPKDLEKYPFCLREAGSGTRAVFEQFVQRNRLIPKIRWEATCPDAVRRAVLQNGCLAVMPLRQVEPDAARGQMHIITGPHPAWNAPYYFVYHKDKELSPELRAIQEILKYYDRPIYPETLDCGHLIEDKDA